MNNRLSKPFSEPLFPEREFIEQGVAVVPILVKDKGEMTNLIFLDKQVTVPYTTHRVISRLCRMLFLDLRSLQQYVSEKLYKKQLLPIPLSFELVLFPIRAAQEGQVRTNGFLWVVHRQLQKVTPLKDQKNHSELLFCNGYRICVPYSPHFIHQQMRDASLVEYWFREAHYLSPFEQRPAFSGPSVLHHRDELQLQLLKIADSLRKYPS